MQNIQLYFIVKGNAMRNEAQLELLANAESTMAYLKFGNTC